MNCKEKVKKQLNDITQSKIINKSSEHTYIHKISGDYDIWRLTRYIFADILSFKVFDRPIEKVNWIINFTYKNKYNCKITHEKFGFRIYVTANSEEEAKNVSENLEKLLHNALFTTMPMIEECAKKALKEGQIIIENKFGELLRTYDYFQKVTLRKRRKSVKSIKLAQKNLIKNITIQNKARLESTYYENASYFAFFSLLEHICLLFLSFRNIPERENIEKFLHLKWGEKFKKVFDINEVEFKDIYDKLMGLAKYKRNPSAHGGANTVFNFYLEGAKHKVPCTLHDNSISIRWNSPEDNFGVMKSFLKLIRKHTSTRNIFAYIEAGMNTSFTKKGSIHNDEISLMSNYEIKKYIEYMSRMYDNHANMDW